MIAPARVAAYEVLRAVGSGRADLATALAQARAGLADPRDRALASEIATGVQRWRGTLDHLIAHFSNRQPERLDAEVLDILRLSGYQLLHLSRVPAAAVVDDAVDIAKRAGKRSAGGLVNAVLRSLSRHRRELPLLPRPDGTDREASLQYFAISLSHPLWLAARWYDRYGFDRTERWMRFNNEPAPLTLRANTIVTSARDLADTLIAAGVQVRSTRFAPDGLVVESGSALAAGLADSGLFVVQDEASQLVPLLSPPRPTDRVFDACASPGGKTIALAARLSDRGLVIAADVRQRRIRLLERTLERARAGAVRLVQCDLRQPLPFAASFDLVLVDAPCSGLGTLRRDPDIRWRRHESDLPSLAATQLTMLRNAAEAVAVGGRLVYATCSSEPEENEAVSAAFLREMPAFVTVDLRSNPNLPQEVIDERGHLRTYPYQHGLEAFYGCVFERTSHL
jgi:16S rRNA (cytosine967-C5)-methyltransferase